ncbi:LysR family transcriptional regulator [Rhizobacter sp. J219]|jgi:DNA-binding transcriptional LysR family regulator|uniref:LysR family transcriptional regulator n=1 Tax=Rhizobacter sp. J219 TaxID=2898430 RepID=UPI002150FDDE|nr:LysR family transcriptional regulator [Rhizobacter sp. J219]MCR5881579.1 LysR family transcriptional regulator [Rhizobacter sp. J219]
MSGDSTQIELRVWRQFLVLAEVLHFGRAAKQLNITQPPLTLAIQQLEARLGVPLFERTRRQVSLTPAGQALVEPVRQLLQQASALCSIARTVGQGAVGRLRLGFVSTVGFGPLPGWLRGFRDIEPGIEVVLREATSDVQLRAFELGEADAGFVLHAPGIVPEGTGQSLSRLSVSIEPMVLAVPENSPLTTARRLTLSQILAQPLIIFPREIAPSLYDAVLAFYHRHSASLVIAQEAIQMQTIVNLVSAGLGLAWVPQSVTTLQRPGVVYRRLPVALGAMAPRAETSLVWPSDAGPVVTRFVDYVRRTLDDQHEPDLA